jgi:hypothetical protein
MASTHETYLSNGAASDAGFLGRPSQSFASMSMQGSPGGYSNAPFETPFSQAGPFRGGRDSSPASSESADHYAERYRSYSGEMRDESAPILAPGYPTSPMDESFPPRTGMVASERLPDCRCSRSFAVSTFRELNWLASQLESVASTRTISEDRSLVRPLPLSNNLRSTTDVSHLSIMDLLVHLSIRMVHPVSGE